MRKLQKKNAPKSARPVIGITLGDPAGIGPEVIAKALRDTSLRRLADFILIGDGPVFQTYFPKRPAGCALLDIKTLLGEKIIPGESSTQSARAALAYLQKGIELIREKRIQGLVTGPLSKEAVSRIQGVMFQGHTEFLAEAFGVANFDMMFVAQKMRTVVVTRHIPLSEVIGAITTKKVLQTILLTAQSLKSLFKIADPRLAVCGVNPHAGEGGKMGREEIEKIAPAIQAAQQQGIRVQGPFPADTIFCPELRKNFDVLIAMYHDQGIIPVKTVAFNTLVNMTIGLPFIRTSPAHGTAFNIAGKNLADPDSMKAAIRLAARLARR